MELSLLIPANAIIPLGSQFVKTMDDLKNNPEYPTLDADALMSGIFEIITCADAFFIYTRDDEVRYMLESNFGNISTDLSDTTKNKIASHVEVILDSVWSALEKHGVFIDGQQPYEFARFVEPGVVLLRKTKILNY